MELNRSVKELSSLSRYSEFQKDIENTLILCKTHPEVTVPKEAENKKQESLKSLKEKQLNVKYDIITWVKRYNQNLAPILGSINLHSPRVKFFAPQAAGQKGTDIKLLFSFCKFIGNNEVPGILYAINT